MSAAGHDLDLLSTPELLRLPDPVWLMDGVLPRAAVSVVYGQPETGKSFVALDWSVCISEGIPWLGLHRTKQAPVIYIAAEGGSGIKKRVRALMEHYGVRDLPAMHWQVVPLLIREEGVLERTLDQLNDDVEGINPGLIVFDTLSRSFSSGDENASTDMTHFVGKVLDLSTRKGAAVLIVHHTNATGSRERGHGSLRGNVNTMFKCVSTQNSDNKLISVTVENDKQKDDAKLKTIYLDVKLIGASLVLVPGEAPEKAKKGDGADKPMRQVDMVKVLGAAENGMEWEAWRGHSGGIPKSSFSRRVKRLLDTGVIYKENGRYFVTPATADLADMADED